MSLYKLRHCNYHVHLCMIITLTCLFLIMVNNILSRIIAKEKDFEIQRDISSNNHSRFALETQEPNLNQSSQPEINLKFQRIKLVLLWSPLFEGWRILPKGRRGFSDAGCLETRCEVTSDRSRFHESDAVVFHSRTMSLDDIPSVRKPEQKWIFFNMEAPPYSRFHGMAFMSGMFNWTMTYRDDSDIVIHYGRSIRTDKPTLDEQELFSSWKKKSKMAVWMVSNCVTPGRREHYVKEMEKYVDVAIYGRCGMAACSEHQTEECLENFSKTFFFYLSFENSICTDYVTEKFYMSLKHNMIPIVFGGGNYSSIAPPGSYINAFDFTSPKELSSHLYLIATNFTLYAKYFQWKMEGYRIEATETYCTLCDKLHSNSFLYRTIYSDIEDWWVKKSHCRIWETKIF